MPTLFLVPKRLTTDEFHRLFASRLKQIREDLPLSKAAFARLLGIRPNTYRKYELAPEDGGTLLPMELIPSICEITGHDPWYVLTGQATQKAARFTSKQKPPIRRAS